jgi:hypothetical protein
MIKIEFSTLKKMIISGNNNLQNHKDLVDRLNVFPVPDGDTGTNMSLTMSSAIKELNDVKEETIKAISTAVTRGSLMGARGNSGVILSQILRGFSKSIESKDMLTTEDIALALLDASNTAYKAVIKPVEGTILTVIRETAEGSIGVAKKTTSMVEFFEDVLKIANESLERTPELLPSLKEAGVVDSGGKGLVLFLEGMYKALKNEDIELKQQSDKSYEEMTADVLPMSIDDITFAYCTEFILKTNKIDDIKIRELMMPLGDSLAVVSFDDIIKVHVHTNEPNKALEIALRYGRLETIKIENMIAQFEANQSEALNKPEEEKEYAIISTSMGSGIAQIFRDLGVTHIIEGGQTMNPSTEDFLNAVENANARNIIILPNNSNIIMAANQAKELSEKNIVVVPTKTVPQGIVSMMSFNEEATLEENEENMISAIDTVKTGQITHAVRDTVINDIEIKEGNYIGIAEKEIAFANTNLTETTVSTVLKLVNEDSFMISLFYGEDVTEDEAMQMKSNIEDKCPDIDIEVFKGNQPLYYYLISVE